MEWLSLARDVDVGGRPMAVTAHGVPLVLWRPAAGAEPMAFPDRCPHREAPLTLGCMKDGRLQCAYHGWQFGSGGALVNVPSALPGVPVPPTGNLKPYHAKERYGLVWVCIDTPEADIPCISHDARAEFRRINNPVERWSASPTRLTDNFMDYTHFPYVHTGTFGTSLDPTVPRYEIEPLEDGWTGYQYEVDVDNPSLVLVPGMYAYLREPAVLEEWKQQFRPEFLWEPATAQSANAPNASMQSRTGCWQEASATCSTAARRRLRRQTTLSWPMAGRTWPRCAASGRSWPSTSRRAEEATRRSTPTPS